MRAAGSARQVAGTHQAAAGRPAAVHRALPRRAMIVKCTVETAEQVIDENAA